MNEEEYQKVLKDLNEAMARAEEFKDKDPVMYLKTIKIYKELQSKTLKYIKKINEINQDILNQSK